MLFLLDFKSPYRNIRMRFENALPILKSWNLKFTGNVDFKISIAGTGNIAMGF